MTASDPGNPDPSSSGGDSGAGVAHRPRASRLAIAAFVMGLGGVCPPLGFIAMIMGFVAYFRITRSGGRMGGRGYALWALVIGAATTIIWIEVWDRSGSWVLEQWETGMETEIREIFAAASEDDADAIRVSMGIEPGGHQEGIEGFISEVRGGGLEPWSISIKAVKPVDSSLSQPVMEADVRVYATDQTIWTGVARFVLEPSGTFSLDSPDSLLARPVMQRFKLIGPDGRILRLPEMPAIPADPPVEDTDDLLPATGGE